MKSLSAVSNLSCSITSLCLVSNNSMQSQITLCSIKSLIYYQICHVVSHLSIHYQISLCSIKSLIISPSRSHSRARLHVRAHSWYVHLHARSLHWSVLSPYALSLLIRALFICALSLYALSLYALSLYALSLYVLSLYLLSLLLCLSLNTSLLCLSLNTSLFGYVCTHWDIRRDSLSWYLSMCLRSLYALSLYARSLSEYVHFLYALSLSMCSLCMRSLS